MYIDNNDKERFGIGNRVVFINHKSCDGTLELKTGNVVGIKEHWLKWLIPTLGDSYVVEYMVEYVIDNNFIYSTLEAKLIKSKDVLKVVE